MKVVYIAGPYRESSYWEQENNVRRAEALALEVWRAGAACICPHANTRFFQGAADDEVWLKGDIEIMDRCNAVLMTRDFARSKGAVAEWEHAKKVGLRVLYSIEELREWLTISRLLETPDAGSPSGS